MSAYGSPIDRIRGQASQLFKAGRLEEAGNAYRNILEMSPSDFDAIHHLGMVAIMTGRLEEARRLLQAALDLSPNNPEVWLHYGMSLQHQGRADEAVTAYEHALNLKPDYSDAMFCLGVTEKNAGRRDKALIAFNHFIALRGSEYPALLHRGDLLRDQGDLGGAMADYESALTINPDYFDGWMHRGVLLGEQGRLQEALDCYDHAVRIAPERGDAWYNRGITLESLNRVEEALDAYEKAVQFAPDFPDAWNNRGAMLRKLAREDEALASFDRALKIDPAHPQALSNRGAILTDQRRFDEALANYDQALTAAPDAQSWYNRGVTLRGLGRGQEALAAYDQAVALKPDFADAWNNRGVVLRDAGRTDEAMDSFRRALGIDPRHADSLANHGAALQAARRFEDAGREFRRLELVSPEHPYLLSGLLMSAIALCDWQTLEDIEERLKSEVINGKAVVPPLPLMGAFDDPALHQAAAKHYLADLLGHAQAAPAPKPAAHDRIRLAYVSNDFYAHATARLMADLLERHDRSKFEVIAISFGPDEQSDVRDRLLKSFDQFHDVRGMSDLEAAELMRRLEIDIAIDLKGYTGGARPGIFAQGPAPVTVNYLGYPGTTGADFMQYVLADPVSLPTDNQAFYSEKIVHLPATYQPNDPKRVIGAVPSREEAGLPADGFVFCCFNNHWKITQPVFQSWMRILKAVPDSVLWLLSDSADAGLARAAEGEGIDPKRLIFAPRMAHAQHLGRLSLADLVLDTMPYNAHTTASDALWCGVPVLTVAGQSFAARVAASLNTAIGLPELIAKNLSAYEDGAVAIAKDPKKLKALKAKLAKNRGAKPLFDAPAFCQAIETAYCRIMEAARRGNAPISFALSPD